MSETMQRAKNKARQASRSVGQWAFRLAVRLGVLVAMAAITAVVTVVVAAFVVVTPVTPFDIANDSSTAYTVDCAKIGAVINKVDVDSSNDSAMKKWGFESKSDRRFQAIDAALKQRLTICHK